MARKLLRLANAQEIKQWDALLTRNPDGGDVLQSQALALTKQKVGWHTEYWVYELERRVVYATVLVRRFTPFGTACYVVRGPGVTDPADLQEIVTLNRTKKGVFMIKMEPKIHAPAAITNLVKVPNVQPNANTIELDLSRPLEDILMSFKARARREIRASEKVGVTVKQVALTEKTARQMYDLYAETGGRGHFFVRPFAYHFAFWRAYAERERGFLFFAYAPNSLEPIAGAFICTIGTRALYKDGGSVRPAPLPFSHRLQWEIIQFLHQHGIASYDLHGCPPQSTLKDGTHPLYSLGVFKTSFSPTVTSYIGAYDQVLQHARYQAWRMLGERLYRCAYRVRRKGGVW